MKLSNNAIALLSIALLSVIFLSGFKMATQQVRVETIFEQRVDTVYMHQFYSECGNFTDVKESAKKLTKKEFTAKYADAAIRTEQLTGITAELILSQAYLESGGGASIVAVFSRNFFGVKCFSKKCKKGHCSNYHDDHHKDFFTNYPTVAASFKDHANVIKERKRYSWICTNLSYWKYLSMAKKYNKAHPSLKRRIVSKESWHRLTKAQKQAHGVYVSGYATAKHYGKTTASLCNQFAKLLKPYRKTAKVVTKTEAKTNSLTLNTQTVVPAQTPRIELRVRS